MKTIRKVQVEPIYVDEIPVELEENKLYITMQYNSTSHLCLCGCKTECSLPIDSTGWHLAEHPDGKISLSPSILQRFECKSHYIINNNIANFV